MALKNHLYADCTQISSLTPASAPNTKLLCPVLMNISVCLINITKIIHQTTTVDLLSNYAQISLFLLTYLRNILISQAQKHQNHPNSPSAHTMLPTCQQILPAISSNPIANGSTSSPISLVPCTDY